MHGQITSNKKGAHIMKTIRNLLIISSAMLLSLPAICSAEQPKAGPYVSGFIGVSIPRDSSVTTDDYNTPATYQDEVEFDPGINIGGTGGYDFGYFRFEGEISYRNSEISSITDQNGVKYRRADGNLGVAAFMTNAFFDLHNASRVTPYLGGGIGFATLQLSDTYGTDQTSARWRLYDEGDDTVFAYQVGAGVDIAINRRFSLDLGYRYFGTDTAKINEDSAWVNSLKFESHNVAVGFRVNF